MHGFFLIDVVEFHVGRCFVFGCEIHPFSVFHRRSLQGWLLRWRRCQNRDENWKGLLSFVGPRTDRYLTGVINPYQLPWKWVTRGYEPYKPRSYFYTVDNWIRGENLVEVLIIYKTLPKTIGLFGKCIRNSQKDCQLGHPQGKRHQLPFGWRDFFWWDFVGLIFFFWYIAK